MEQVAQILRLVGDETRLRILVLVSETALNVSELTSILGMAQSGVSRHLGHLRKLGLLQEHKQGVWTYYQLSGKESLPGELQLLWEYLQEQFSAFSDPYNDRVRLQEILRQREVGGPGLNERLLEPGQTWYAWSRLLGMFLTRYPDHPRDGFGNKEAELSVIDLGCGDGSLTLEMARFARHVIGVDFNPEVLAAARQRMDRLNLQHIALLAEDVSSLPLDSNTLDAAFFSQSLHHLADPQRGFAEAVRLLRTGGAVLAMELAAHNEKWVLEKLNHKWLGFDKDELLSMMQDSGLTGLQAEVLPKGRGEVFQVILAMGIKS